MTCLTVTPSSAAEAVQRHADLVVAHHPLPFRPLKRITSSTTPGRLLLQLIESGVAIYSPHTAFDSTYDGINQWLSEIVGVAAPRPLIEHDEGSQIGTGRWGELFQPMTIAELALRLKLALGQEKLQVVGDPERQVKCAAVGCGSAGELLESARRAGCELFVTGEASFHTCLEAEANELAMILIGHYASERFAVERLALILGDAFAGVNVWASQREADPLQWL